MLTAYFTQLQHASAGIQVASCLLGSLAFGALCFAPGLIFDHVRANRTSC